MKYFRTFLIAFIILLCIVILRIGCTKDGVLSLVDKKNLSWDQMIQEIGDKKIIIIGALRDEPKHQKYQLRIIKSLHERGVSIAIGLEMFNAIDQTVLDRWVAGYLTLDQFPPTPHPSWPLYKDAFLFSRDKKIPLIALNVPVEISRNVLKKGFASLTDEERRQLPPGISCNVDETYMAFIKRAYSVRSSEKEFTKFCEAQMVLDNAMALHTLKYLEKYPNSTVIILSAADHAWKRAVPRQIERLRKGYPISVILPELTHIQREIMTVEDADFLMLK